MSIHNKLLHKKSHSLLDRYVSYLVQLEILIYRFKLQANCIHY